MHRLNDFSGSESPARIATTLPFDRSRAFSSPVYPRREILGEVYLVHTSQRVCELTKFRVFTATEQLVIFSFGVVRQEVVRFGVSRIRVGVVLHDVSIISEETG